MAARRPIYSTYEELVFELSSLANPANSKTIASSHGLRLLNAVSRRVDGILGGRLQLPWFGPWLGPYDLELDPHDYSSRQGWWHIHQPLHRFDTLAQGETAVDNVTMFENHLYLPSTSSWNCVYNGLCSSAVDQQPRLTVAGLWGWTNGDPLDEVDILTVAMDDDEITSDLGVATPTATDPLTGGEVYELGTVLLVDDEFMSVLVRGTSVQVGRGLFGSAKAAHEIGAIVYRWTYPEALSHEVARQAAMLYARRGAFTAEIVDGVGLTTYPPDLLSSLRSTLQDFQR